MSVIPRLLISAAHKSSGKTVFSTGLCAELTSRGFSVFPFKKGPDYIDPQWLAAAAQRSCCNLDFNTQKPDEITGTFARRRSTRSADDVFFGDAGLVRRRDDPSGPRVSHGDNGTALAVIEANKGLYDGVSLDGSDSNAALAKLLFAPVILVVDCEGMTRGIAPLLRGYLDFDVEVHIAGVVLNKVRGKRHEDKLGAATEHYTGLPVVGCIGYDERMSLPQRHLGLLPGNEHRQAGACVEAMRQVISKNVDVEAIIGIAHTVGQVDKAARRPEPTSFADGCCHGKEPGGPSLAKGTLKRTMLRSPAGSFTKKKTLGVFFDAAFSFYYPDDLEAFVRAGFRLLPISALRDTALPAVDAFFIGGGFPEVHAAELEANVSLRASIRSAIEGGLPAYAECGGLMYLSRGIEWRGRCRAMVGVIPADTVMSDRPCGRGYVKIEMTPDMPWPEVDGGPSVYTAHEFHYSRLSNLPGALKTAYRVLRGEGIGSGRDGIVYKNLLASFVHLRTANSDWVKRFTDFCKLAA